MLQYLLVILDDRSVSICNYDVGKEKNNLMSIELLKKVIVFGMKENVMFQYIYPNYTLPKEYEELIEWTEHAKIIPATQECANADMIVISDFEMLKNNANLHKDKSYIVKCDIDTLDLNLEVIKELTTKVSRVNLIVNTPIKFDEKYQRRYKSLLDNLGDIITESIVSGSAPQLNILTDRIALSEMNNCGAGENTLTVAPDGNFYICPAFYQSAEGNESDGKCGSIEEGVKIANNQLYRLEFAPVCRICDAFHCRRCIWLNKKATLEVNTPGKGQCVISHLERNASSLILKKVKEKCNKLDKIELQEEKCLDPFDKIINKFK